MLGTTGPVEAEHDYDVEELLEPSGGQGFVFRARLTSDRLGPGMRGTAVSLKQLIDGAVGVDRIRELDAVIRPRTHQRLARQLEVFSGRPVTVDDADVDPDDDSMTYVAAVWVDGQTIDRAADGQPLEAILRWVSQVGEALDYLHANCHDGGPVMHRDVKPHNVIVATTGDAVLIDPGLARPVVAGATGTPHGSPGYIPPEAQGGLRPSTLAGDRWQLAALTFCLITGEPPGRLPVASVHAQLTASLRATHDPGPISDLMARMLDPQPDRRPRSAADWAHDLRIAEARSRRRPRAGRRRTTALAGGVVALATATTIGFVAGPHTGRNSAEASSMLPTDSRLLPHATAASMPVTVYNKVTNGPTLMREDVPAYLSTEPEDYCRSSGCAIPDTDMMTGTLLTATCQTVAELTTNGDNTTPVDAHNPGRYTSDRWYGITLPGGRHGFLWEGWLAPEDRGGGHLPQC